jgi:dihydroorotate dehydrogenase (NAD+) catalytic subunit
MIEPDLSVNIGALKLKNPVMVASGVFGYGFEYDGLCPPEKLGAIIAKGISLKPSPGNPPPRIWETPSGMLNAIGLENVGIDRFIDEKMPPLVERGVTVIANFYGSTIDEYVEVARRLSEAHGLAAIEANISCPNVGGKKGLHFGSTPEIAAQVTRAIRKATDKFLIVKLTPQVQSISEVAKAVAESGADAISLINTIPAMAVDVRTRKPRLANVTGGLSGPAIHPVAVKMVWEAARSVKIPVIGIGGIMTVEDALEFIIVGAKAVQIGTAVFANPAAPLDIIEGMMAFLREQNISSISKLVGTVITDAINCDK